MAKFVYVTACLILRVVALGFRPMHPSCSTRHCPRTPRRPFAGVRETLLSWEGKRSLLQCGPCRLCPAGRRRRRDSGFATQRDTLQTGPDSERPRMITARLPSFFPSPVSRPVVPALLPGRPCPADEATTDRPLMFSTLFFGNFECFHQDTMNNLATACQ